MSGEETRGNLCRSLCPGGQGGHIGGLRVQMVRQGCPLGFGTCRGFQGVKGVSRGSQGVNEDLWKVPGGQGGRKGVLGDQ